MDRKQLLSSIRLVAPALGDGSLVPQQEHLWFNGESVLAYDGRVGISTPCKLDFKGGLPSPLLLQVLPCFSDNDNNSKVKFTVSEQEACFQVCRAHLSLKIMNADRAIFVMPEPKGPRLQFANRNQLAKALAHCVEFVGRDVLHAEWCGVVLEAREKELCIFAGDEKILVEARVELKEPAKFRIILPKKFCKQIVAHPDAQLEIHEAYALLSSNKVTVYGSDYSFGDEPPLNQKDFVSSAVKLRPPPRPLALPSRRLMKC